MKQYNKTCATCNKYFVSSRSHTVYCSRLCHRRHPDNRQKYSDRVKKYQSEHSREPKRRYQKLFFKAKYEKRDFNILETEYIALISSPCLYCNNSLLTESGCGLDRVDNNQGYTLDNVVPCCGPCNQIRNVHLTHDEMIVAMKAIVEYRNGKEPANI